eukprot:460417-Rhodomonas_salina.3
MIVKLRMCAARQDSIKMRNGNPINFTTLAFLTQCYFIINGVGMLLCVVRIIATNGTTLHRLGTGMLMTCESKTPRSSGQDKAVEMKSAVQYHDFAAHRHLCGDAVSYDNACTPSQSSSSVMPYDRDVCFMSLWNVQVLDDIDGTQLRYGRHQFPTFMIPHQRGTGTICCGS